MKEDLDFWIPETKSATFGSRGSVGVVAWSDSWHECAAYLAADGCDLGRAIGDVKRMVPDVAEGHARAGWLACIEYADGRHGISDDDLIRDDLRAILATFDMGARSTRPSMGKKRA